MNHFAHVAHFAKLRLVFSTYFECTALWWPETEVNLSIVSANNLFEVGVHNIVESGVFVASWR